jgi:restriction system protein
MLGWLKWWGKSDAAPATAQVEQQPKEDPQVRHIRKTMEFAKAQQRSLKLNQWKKEAWERQFANAQVDELDGLSGEEFEGFLEGLFREFGYEVELTAISGDYGADLILTKDRQRIAVQAKRYRGSVGVQAVQEALSGQAYYRCNSAWVVTTGTFTPNALELAAKSSVKMIGRTELGKLMAQSTRKTGHA